MRRSRRTPPARRSRRSWSRKDALSRSWSPSTARWWSRRAVLLALTSYCCGYALAGRGSFLPPDIRTVSIPQLLNESTVFNVEQVLTEKIRAEFIGRGKYRVVADATGIDALLSGTVTGINVQPVGFTEQQLASR